MATQESSDDQLRARAIHRVNEKHEFALHVVVYVAVNALIIAIWAFTSDGGFFWPVWPLLGWGIGLAVHGAKVYIAQPSESAIEREMGRLKRDH
jgi:hypothetical protein